ncbi:MAG: Rossmann-like and DUF2520 domain-containing protein [Roseobacter sp.]
MTTTTVNIIGAGRVGCTFMGLVHALPDYSIQDVFSARFASAQDAVARFQAGRAVDCFGDLRSADIWIVSVPDDKISQVAAALADCEHVQSSHPVAFHCSGYFAADHMAVLRPAGWHLASVHPVLSFSDPQVAMAQFPGVLCGIEGDPVALNVVTALLKGLHAQPFAVDPAHKSRYHAAAVFSNNFAVVLQAMAQELWASAGVTDEIAAKLNKSLLEATCANVIAHGPQAALTGPAARGDDWVVTRQGAAVAEWNPAAGRLYADMSVLAQRLKSTGTTRS